VTAALTTFILLCTSAPTVRESGTNPAAFAQKTASRRRDCGKKATTIVPHRGEPFSMLEL
jgi:hypothetical protein